MYFICIVVVDTPIQVAPVFLKIVICPLPVTLAQLMRPGIGRVYCTISDLISCLYLLFAAKGVVVH